MATKQALRVNAARYSARQALMLVLRPLGDGIVPAWRAVLLLERAAIRCGEARERGRAARKARTR